MSGFIGCGTLYGAVIVAGVRQELLDMGNATVFEIQENGDLKTRPSKKCASYGEALDTTLIRSPAGVKFTLDDLNKDVLASLFNSKAVENINNTATVVDELVTDTSVTAGAILRTSLRNISNVVVKSNDGLTVYDVGTDYAVENANAGMIKLLAGTSIVASDLKVSYDSAASKTDVMKGGSAGETHLYLLLEGTNRVDNKPFSVEAYDAAFKANTAFDFLAEDYNKLALDGMLLVDEAKGGSYVLTLEK